MPETATHTTASKETAKIQIQTLILLHPLKQSLGNPPRLLLQRLWRRVAYPRSTLQLSRMSGLRPLQWLLRKERTPAPHGAGGGTRGVQKGGTGCTEYEGAGLFEKLSEGGQFKAAKAGAGAAAKEY